MVGCKKPGRARCACLWGLEQRQARPIVITKNIFLISKILQLGSKIPEFKARFEPLNSQSKLRTPVYQLPAEESC